jgi:hypothetical protein
MSQGNRGEANRSFIPKPPKAGVVNFRGESDSRTRRQVVRYQFIYSLIGLVLGLVCILGGIILFVLGITGATSWTLSMLGADSKALDAAPGAVLFIVGIFIVLLTRFMYKER